jgi:DNA polymerase-3 subunit delta
MKKLKEHIKQNQFLSCYLFYGEEEFLKKRYLEQVTNKMIPQSAQMMNMDLFQGKNITANQIIEISETFPFMAEKRLVIVKDSGFLKTGRKDDTEKVSEFIENILDTTCLIFVENDIDKRNKLYKRINKVGYVVEFQSPKENELITWIKKGLKQHQKEIDNKTAVHMLRTVGTNMEELVTEMEKISTYKGEETVIQKDDIDKICTKSLEIQIFDLVKAMGYKNPTKALTIYSNLILMKESPIMILSMLTRQFRLILQVKTLRVEGYDQNRIAERLKQRTFIVRDCLKQADYFSMNVLKRGIQECLETDVAIKTGRLESKLAVEMLLVKYSSQI